MIFSSLFYLALNKYGCFKLLVPYKKKIFVQDGRGIVKIDLICTICRNFQTPNFMQIKVSAARHLNLFLDLRRLSIA